VGPSVPGSDPVAVPPCDNREVMEGPIIVRKTPVGLFLTYLVGAAVTAGVLLGFVLSITGDGMNLTRTAPKALLLAALIVILATILQSHVYALSRMEIDRHELRFVHWRSLISSTAMACEWRDVLDVRVRAGLGGRSFGYGTIVVRLGSDHRDLRIPMIPNPEHWRAVIQRRAYESGASL
jgi:hypothetical protein